MFTVRSTLLASAFALTIAAAVTGARPRGVTPEVTLDAACAAATWPAIPSTCLAGAVDRPVRVIAIAGIADRTMPTRFAAAFE